MTKRGIENQPQQLLDLIARLVKLGSDWDGSESDDQGQWCTFCEAIEDSMVKKLRHSSGCPFKEALRLFKKIDRKGRS